jgi:hypothetical protein
MKKKIYLIATILLSAAALSLSSCLKDSRFVDFSKVAATVEFPYGGQAFFGKAAVTATPDTDAKGTIALQFAVNISSVNVPTTATTVTFSADDPALVQAYNNLGGAVVYTAMPANAYVFTQTSVTIPGGQRSAVLNVTFYKNLLDPSKSYMLPIAIKSAGGINISGNQGIMYWHFIGNVFAGSYTQNFMRYNGFSSPPPPGTTPSGGSFTGAQVTVSPVTPTHFEVVSGYFTDNVNYDVTFTQIDATHYGNFQISLNATDVANNFTPSGIVVTQAPVFGYGVTPAYDPNAAYTYAQALTYFTFQYTVQNSSGYRYNVDQYIHN